jgi:hypothetical protein
MGLGQRTHPPCSAQWAQKTSSVKCAYGAPDPSARAVNAAQRRSAAYVCATTWSPATTRASPRKPGNAPAAAAPDQPAQQSFAPGQDPTRPAPRRSQGTQSPQQATETRRGQDQPLPSPPVPPSTTARQPRSPAKDSAGCRAPNQFLVTLTVHTNKINCAMKPRTTSANSMTNKTPVVVIQRDGQHPCSRTPQTRRRNGSGS